MYRLKRKNKKGYILVEAVLALAIISISLVSVFGVKSYIDRRKKMDLQNIKYVNYIEALKNEIYYNETYENLKSKSVGAKYYIAKESINMEALKSRPPNMSYINTLIKNKLPNKLPYICIEVLEDGNVLKIIISMHTSCKNSTTILYKGDY